MNRNEIIKRLTEIYPYAIGLKINQTMSGSHSVFVFNVHAMQIASIAKCETISFELSKVDNPEQYGLSFKLLKSPEPNIRFNIHNESDIDTLRFLIEDIFHSCRNEATFDSFGCCSSFNECSDIGHCIHQNDPEYWGCQYKRNLEKGNIFYGKNKTI